MKPRLGDIFLYESLGIVFFEALLQSDSTQNCVEQYLKYLVGETQSGPDRKLTGDQIELFLTFIRA